MKTCKRGHLQTPENVNESSDGRRRCRLCAQFRRRRQHEKVKRPCPHCGEPMTHTSAQCQACRKSDLETRFLRYVEKFADCWLWTGHLDARGYGRFTTSEASERAHRVAYRLWVGEIPSGHSVHHRCHNKLCVRPAHLQALTADEHQRLHRMEQTQ